MMHDTMNPAHLRGAASAETKRRITKRECEVLTWVARGKSAREIAEILKIAKRTVDEHMQKVFQKLGAVNRPHAVAIAMRDKLIELCAKKSRQQI
jgi:LuxR family quorum sensing-dependent transcriptional regulator